MIRAERIDSLGPISLIKWFHGRLGLCGSIFCTKLLATKISFMAVSFNLLLTTLKWFLMWSILGLKHWFGVCGGHPKPGQEYICVISQPCLNYNKRLSLSCMKWDHSITQRSIDQMNPYRTNFCCLEFHGAAFFDSFGSVATLPGFSWRERERERGKRKHTVEASDCSQSCSP